jgi:hypothetical protein
VAYFVALDVIEPLHDAAGMDLGMGVKPRTPSPQPT